MGTQVTTCLVCGAHDSLVIDGLHGVEYWVDCTACGTRYHNAACNASYREAEAMLDHIKEYALEPEWRDNEYRCTVPRVS